MMHGQKNIKLFLESLLGFRSWHVRCPSF